MRNKDAESKLDQMVIRIEDDMTDIADDMRLQPQIRIIAVGKAFLRLEEEKEMVAKIKGFDAGTLRVMLYSIEDKEELKRLVQIGEDYLILRKTG